MKIRLTIEYEGTNYQGWQSQNNGQTIQEKIEETLEKILKNKVSLMGASRTDSGVHARGQVAHFECFPTSPNINFMLALNSLLPRDIRIHDATKVSDDFHAQFNAQSKTYAYYILNRALPSAVSRNFCYWVPDKLDISLMQLASALLRGVHDFKSFQGSKSSVKSTVREVYECGWYEEGEFIVFRIKAKGFLKHMIRNIVGTLLEIGRGRFSLVEFQDILDAQDRTRAGPTAPPQGLFLERIAY